MSHRGLHVPGCCPRGQRTLFDSAQISVACGHAQTGGNGVGSIFYTELRVLLASGRRADADRLALAVLSTKHASGLPITPAHVLLMYDARGISVSCAVSDAFGGA